MKAKDYTEGMVIVTDSEAKERVAANVQTLLNRRGLSGRALARITGDSAVRINDVVRGEHVPNIGVLTRIAAALDTTVDFLVMHEPEKISRECLMECNQKRTVARVGHDRGLAGPTFHIQLGGQSCSMGLASFRWLTS